MLLYIFYLGVPAQPETVDSIMSGILVATVVDTAACNDHHITAGANIKIIVHHILQAALAEHHRNVHAFFFRARVNKNINAGLIQLGFNINNGGGVAGSAFSVGTNVVSAHRQGIQLRHLMQQAFLDCIHHGYFPSILSVSTLQAALSALFKRLGRISALSP